LTFVFIGSSDPRFLCATDLLIGDMSDINYEFLLFDRPIILIANDWLEKNFPNIGMKTNLERLKDDILVSLHDKTLYQAERKKLLDYTISITDEKASKRYIDIMIQRSGIENPEFIFNDGNNEVRKTNLIPLYNEVKKRETFGNLIVSIPEGMSVENAKDYLTQVHEPKKIILVGAHFRDLPEDLPGYKVHIDHALKGKGTTNLQINYKEYEEKNHHPHIDLHICAGKAGENRTKWLLQQYTDRTAIGGYPKGDDLLRLNTKENKNAVYEELGLEKGIPLITYAPAGELSDMKPGGSLCAEVINKLKEISIHIEAHIFVKLKYNWMKLPGVE